MAYAPADPGQTLLATAVDSDASYSYRVTYKIIPISISLVKLWVVLYK